MKCRGVNKLTTAQSSSVKPATSRLVAAVALAAMFLVAAVVGGWVHL